MVRCDHQVTIRVGRWPRERDIIRDIRNQVFVIEQQVPREIEWDDRDHEATHFLAFANNVPVATARLLDGGQLGRMAVLDSHRNLGIGRALLDFVLDFAKSKYSRVHCHAQVRAMDFYQRAGFIQQGDRFFEAGIEHQGMEYIIE